MSRFVSVVTISVLQMVSYLFVNNFLQSLLNKLFRSDFYVLIILFLLIITPILVFVFCNNLFCPKKDYNRKIANVLFTSVLFIIFNVLYYLFFLVKDDDFFGVGLSLYTFWIFVVSGILIIYYSFKQSEKTGQSADGSVIDKK